MSHTAFAEFIPEIAEKETRVVELAHWKDRPVLETVGALIEFYSVDQDCDCKNVFI
jgi:hypothetical protein